MCFGPANASSREHILPSVGAEFANPLWRESSARGDPCRIAERVVHILEVVSHGVLDLPSCFLM